MKTITVPCEAAPARCRQMLLTDDPYYVACSILPPAVTVRRVRLATVALCEACPVAVPVVFRRSIASLYALADSLRRAKRGGGAQDVANRPLDELLAWSRSRPDPCCPHLSRLFNRLWTIRLPYGEPGVDLRTVASYQNPDAGEADILRTIFHGGPSPDEPLPTTLTVPDAAYGIARAVYDDSDRVALAALADLLDEVGNPENATRALRNPHAALRGNWVVDAILRKPQTR